MMLNLISGFPGAGKTTVIKQAANYLDLKDTACRVIVNDRNKCTVNTLSPGNENNGNTQATGGCFCCNHEALLTALEMIFENNNPCVFAEAVGICTDLMEKVMQPLKNRFQRLAVSLTVVVDAVTIFRYFQQERFLFKKSAGYLWQRQIKEADIILVSKLDLLPLNHHALLRQLIATRFQDTQVIYMNRNEKICVEEWLGVLGTYQKAVKYKEKAEGRCHWESETPAACLDAVLEINAPASTIAMFIDNFRHFIALYSYTVFYLKFTVCCGKEGDNVLFESEGLAGRFHPVDLVTGQYTVILNTRIEGSAAAAFSLFRKSINSVTGRYSSVSVSDLNYFSLLLPVPLHLGKTYL